MSLDERPKDKLNTINTIRQKRAYVFSRYLPDPINGSRLEDIRNVLVIISASRSGSSLLYHLLSGHPDVLAPTGEEITLYKLAGLGAIDSVNDSHAIAEDIPLDPIQREALALDILSDAGCPHLAVEADFPVETYVTNCVQRLLLQWSEIDFDCDELYLSAKRALEKHLSTNKAFDAAQYWLDLLSNLISQGYVINPCFYDLSQELIKHRHPSIQIPEGPPSSKLCLEEPPFVVPQPRVFPQPNSRLNKCLLLKSSSNCYRIGFMKKLYPNARFSFIYLTRNPAGAINGLMDGWLSNGFYSQNLGDLTTLEIDGYSLPNKPWSQYWWNFDSPPAWINYVNKPLENVCAFQWRSANEYVIKNIGNGIIDRYLIIKYEDMLNQESLRRQLTKVLDFAQLDPQPILNEFKAPVHVMTVNPPAPKKWMKRRDIIMPALMDSDVISVASNLDYDIKTAEEFV